MPQIADPTQTPAEGSSIGPISGIATAMMAAATAIMAAAAMMAAAMTAAVKGFGRVMAAGTPATSVAVASGMIKASRAMVGLTTGRAQKARRGTRPAGSSHMGGRRTQRHGLWPGLLLRQGLRPGRLLRDPILL